MTVSERIRLAALSLAAGLAAAVQAADITGAGATFPYPLYAKWAQAYQAKTGVGMNYQSIGSGGGINQIKARTIDFGASDMPLDAAELDAGGLIQFPAVMGGVVPVVNLDGVQPGQLKLSGEVLAGIFLGRIAKWNDAAIASLNPGLKLPATAITVVHRSDGSGTTFLFTDYLSKVSGQWKNAVGSGTAVRWPAGVGGKGNEGVSAYVQRIKGAIGYVEYAYARKNRIAHAALKNRDGAFVQPDQNSFRAAAANADWADTPGFRVLLTDQPGRQSWPIAGASFILMYKTQADGAKAKRVLGFFDWAYANGERMAAELDYVPMPSAVVRLVRDAWKRDIRDASGKPVWN